jgi:filamentous hemagglutinin
VGGNLHIASLQDTSTYTSAQGSAGAGVSLCVPPLCYGSSSVSASLGNSNIRGNYQSVTEQSGIRAGDEGFQVAVQGKTDLTGGAITSMQTAIDNDRNRFASAGGMTMADIQNTASYHGGGYGVSATLTGEPHDAQGNPITDGKGNAIAGKANAAAGVGSVGAEAGSTTRAAISGIAGNTQGRTGDASVVLAPILDANQAQKSLDAQVALSAQFSHQAHQAAADYAADQRQTLQTQLAVATTDEERKQIQTQINQVNAGERALNVLIGAVAGQGTVAAAQGVLSEAADLMRQETIANSKLFAGVIDAQGNLLSNQSGVSAGVNGDQFKAAGTRVALDIICGVSNERCVIQKNPDGSPALDVNGKTQLALNAQGQVQFDVQKAGMNLADFLTSPLGEKGSGPTGGYRGAQGTLRGNPYAPNSLMDRTMEAFSGEHDLFGGQAVGLYDSQGNIRRGLSDAQMAAYNVWSAIAIPVVSPFAAAYSLPPDVWNAISIFLKLTK